MYLGICVPATDLETISNLMIICADCWRHRWRPAAAGLQNTNEDVIRSTVNRLPPGLAITFLTDVVGRLEAKPSRATTLLGWIRAVLLIHQSYLMSVSLRLGTG